MAIVLQRCFVLVLLGYRTIIARYAAKWGIAQMCLCETKYQEGYRTISNLPENVSRDMGYRRDSIAISRDMRATKITAEAQNPIPNSDKNAIKTPRLRELFPKSSHELLPASPVTRIRAPTEIVQKSLLRFLGAGVDILG